MSTRGTTASLQTLPSKISTRTSVDSLDSSISKATVGKGNAMQAMLGLAGTMAKGSVPTDSALEAAPNATARRESMKKAMGGIGTGLNEEQQRGGPRQILNLSGVERPILLETRELEQPRLDSLIKDIKEHQSAQLSVDLNRQRKLRSVKAGITELKFKRLNYDLQVWGGSDHHSTSQDHSRTRPQAQHEGEKSHGRSMHPRTWREINETKARKNRADPLHHVAPMERVRVLQGMEAAIRDQQLGLPRVPGSGRRGPGADGNRQSLLDPDRTSPPQDSFEATHTNGTSGPHQDSQNHNQSQSARSGALSPKSGVSTAKGGVASGPSQMTTSVMSNTTSKHGDDGLNPGRSVLSARRS